ncbi:protein translocase subunit SecD [soil metagenome]
MRRNFLRSLLICLVPTALFGVFAWFGTYHPGIDLAGGTILVYELDLDKLKKQQSELNKGPLDDKAPVEGLSTDQMQALAESLKKRIDPVDTRNVIIRPVGGTRVEIILPFTPKQGGAEESAGTEDYVQFVKDIVSRVGVLEFRILANNVDDEEGLRSAEARIAAMTPDEAERLAKAGGTPPSPTEDFRVKVNDVEAEGVRYEWVELGREERNTLGLSNAQAEKSPLAIQLTTNRGKAYRHSYGGQDDGKTKSQSMLLFSRDFKKENFSKDDEGKGVEYYVLTRVSSQDSVKVGGAVGLTARADTDNKMNWVVDFTFNSTGAGLFGAMTERNKPTGSTYRSLAIILDDKIVSAPSLNSRIDGRGQISGNFTKASVERLVSILRSGALTAQLKPNPVSENSVGPTLGRDTINKGLWSVGLAFAAVLVFMLWYYLFAGIVACIALLVNLILTIGFMNAVSAAYTLAGLAGIVLMLGMAVDANVLIYERIREERAKGATLQTAIRTGYERALPTIIDTHLTSIFTAIVLYTFGNDNLKGFAVSLTVGLIISLFTALYVTRLIFDYCLSKKWIHELKMRQLFAKPNINFMSIRKQMFTLTAILTVGGLGLFLLRGEKSLNVDFRGGTAYGGRLTEALSLHTFLESMSESKQKERLVVKDVVRVKPPTDDAGQASKLADDRTFNITYEGAERPVVVTLSNDPAGPGKSEAEQIAALKLRAGHMPDASVEQVYIGGEKSSMPSDASKSFTLRTTEREPELVQAMLDRLLRSPDGKALMASTKMTVGPVTGNNVELTFGDPTSLNYVKSLLKREFRIEFREPTTGEAFTLTGITEGDDNAKKAQASSGKYTKMLVDVSKNSEFKNLKDADPAKVKADSESLTKILEKMKITFESRPVPERLETFDAALAEDTKSRAFYAIVASWVAILLYLWFRFGSWTFGLAAVVCLIHDLCFTLGCIAVCHYLFDLPVFGSIFQLSDFKIDLAAIAALLTLVGYSVNDTIVVFDRIREVRGKNAKLTPQMINDSVNQTLSRTVLASLTVFLVVGVLYFFGGEGVHLFSFVMVVGVIVGTYSSIYIASPLLLIFGEGQEKVADKKPTSELVKA